MLGRIVDVREGEGRLLASTCGILALVTAAHTMLETARDTLFLSKLPPSRLAWVYVLLAILTIIAGAVSSAVSKRFGRRAGFVVSLGVCAYVIALLYLREPTPAMVFVLYVTSGVMGTILTLQFWLFVGQIFTVSQGKRLFGPMAAGGVLGATLGATAAAIVLRGTSATTLLFSAAVLFLLAGLTVTIVPATEGIDDEDRSPVGAFSWLKDVSILRSDRYVALAGGLVAISTATVLMADFLFKSTAAAALGPAKLGPFLGAYYAIQNAVALVVQLFVTGPLVRKLGVTSTLLLFPLLIVLGGASVAATGAFALALVVKGTDGSLRHSLHRVTTELLLLPLPQEIRDRSKRLIDTMLGRGAQALAAAVIGILSAMGAADPRTLGMIVSGLALAWLGAAVALRRPYVDVFRRALARGELPDGDHELDLAAVETLLESLASDDEPHVLAAIDLLAATRRRRLLPALILYHESPAVLSRALEVFADASEGRAGRSGFVPLAERLLGHREPNVRAAAVRALAAAGRREAASLALEDADPKVQAYAAFFLAIDALEPERDEKIAALLADASERGVAARRSLLEVVGKHGDTRWAEVVRAIISKDGATQPFGIVASEAIRRTKTETLAGYLVGELAIREGRAETRAALVSLGEAGYEALVTALTDLATPERVRRQVPRALAAFGTQAAVDLLVARLSEEPASAVRYRILRALGRMSTDAKNGLVGKLRFDRAFFEASTHRCLSEYLALFETLSALEPEMAKDGERPAAELLTGLLADRIAYALERAFRFLQLAHRNEDIESVHYAVVRGDKRARSTALEFLDVLAIGDRDVKALLRIVVDDLPSDERIRRARGALGASGAPLGHDDALKQLIVDKDDLIASLAVAYAAEAGLVEMIHVARREAAKRPAILEIGPAGLAGVEWGLSHA